MLIAVSAPWVAGCGPSSGCYPAALQLSPPTVAPGGQTTLSSPASACHLKGIKRATYVVKLQEPGAPATELARVRPNLDGSFAVVLHVPAGTPPFQASLDVSGSAYDAPCHDTGSKCAGYGVGIFVQPP